MSSSNDAEQNIWKKNINSRNSYHYRYYNGHPHVCPTRPYWVHHPWHHRLRSHLYHIRCPLCLCLRIVSYSIAYYGLWTKLCWCKNRSNGRAIYSNCQPTLDTFVDICCSTVYCFSVLCFIARDERQKIARYYVNKM